MRIFARWTSISLAHSSSLPRRKLRRRRAQTEHHPIDRLRTYQRPRRSAWTATFHAIEVRCGTDRRRRALPEARHSRWFVFGSRRSSRSRSPINTPEHVSVGAPLSLWSGFLLKWASGLRVQIPGIAVSATAGASAVLSQRLIEGTLDLAINVPPVSASGPYDRAPVRRRIRACLIREDRGTTWC